MKKYAPFVDVTVLSGSKTLSRLGLKRSPRPSPYNFHAPGYVTGSASGSFTAEIDSFRQGTNVFTKEFRASRVLPVIDGGEDDFTVVKLNYGYPTLIQTFVPFDDKANFQSLSASSGLLALVEGKITTAQISSPQSDMPILQADKGYNATNIMDGVAEVFPVRFKAFSNKIFSRSLNPLGDPARPGIRAEFGAGDSRGTNIISSLISIKPQEVIPFIDKGFFYEGTEVLSSSYRPAQAGEDGPDGRGAIPELNFQITSSIFMPSDRHFLGREIHKEAPTAPVPFVDSDSVIISHRLDEMKDFPFDIKNQFLTTLSQSSDRFIPHGFKSSRTGFIFTNNGLNVDSLAFGGTNRDA